MFARGVRAGPAYGGCDATHSCPFRDAGWHARARLGDAECDDSRRVRPRGDDRDPGRDPARDLRQQVGRDDAATFAPLSAMIQPASSAL